jgi:hypothetical protein
MTRREPHVVDEACFADFHRGGKHGGAVEGGEGRNWTKTLDPIEAIEICGDLNEQEDKRAKEDRMANAIDREMQRNHIPPLRTGGKGGFWPFGLFR